MPHNLDAQASFFYQDLVPVLHELPDPEVAIGMPIFRGTLFPTGEVNFPDVELVRCYVDSRAIKCGSKTVSVSRMEFNPDGTLPVRIDRDEFGLLREEKEIYAIAIAKLGLGYVAGLRGQGQEWQFVGAKGLRNQKSVLFHDIGRVVTSRQRKAEISHITANIPNVIPGLF